MIDLLIDKSMEGEGLVESVMTISSDAGRLERVISMGRTIVGGKRGGSCGRRGGAVIPAPTPAPPPPLPPAIRSLRGPDGGANGLFERLVIADGPLGGTFPNDIGRGNVYGLLVFVDSDMMVVSLDVSCSSSRGFLVGGDDDDGDDN